MVEGIIYERATPRDGFEVGNVLDSSSEFGAHGDYGRG